MAIGLEQIGLLIKRAREDAGMTQAELADAIGLKNGAQSVSRYERAKTEVTTRRLRRIAEATGKPMSYFIQEPDATDTDASQVRQMVREEVQAALVPVEELLRRLADQAPPGPRKADGGEP